MTAANIETFGEAGALKLPDGTLRAVQMLVRRHDPAPSEIQGQLQPRFTVRLLADATLGATAQELDTGTWKVLFPDEVGGDPFVHDIGKKHGHLVGLVDLDIYGAGSAPG